MAKNKNLANEQIRAIRKSLEVGMQLQRDSHQIADDFRNGMFAQEIISKYDLTSRYGITKKIAKEAVLYALKGVRGNFFGMEYDGLIREDERKKIIEEHLLRNARRMGSFAYEKGLGIFSLTNGQMREIHRKGGEIGGRHCLELKVGIHGLTKEQRKEHGRRIYELRKGCHRLTHEQYIESGRKAGLASAVSRGMVPWRNDEGEFAYTLRELPRDQIAERLNKLYHGGRKVRTASSVCAKFTNLKNNRNL